MQVQSAAHTQDNGPLTRAVAESVISMQAEITNLKTTCTAELEQQGAAIRKIEENRVTDNTKQEQNNHKQTADLENHVRDCAKKQAQNKDVAAHQERQLKLMAQQMTTINEIVQQSYATNDPNANNNMALEELNLEDKNNAGTI